MDPVCPVAQGNDETEWLFIGKVQETSEFYKNQHVNSKGMRKDFSVT